MSTATSTTSRTRNAVNESDLCQFPFQDDRRCHMLRHPEHPCLCIFHARAESQLIETERLGTELGETLTGDFLSATDINHAMGRLYIAVAQDRIPIRNANTLARIGGTLLRTVPGIKTEFKFQYSFDQWKKMVQNAAPLSTPDTLDPSDDSSSDITEPASPPSANPPIAINSGTAGIVDEEALLKSSG
jgi:hypothetical protein